MNITAWVDVAIGVVIVYLGASLFVTVVNEYVAQLRNLRGKQLASSLEKILEDGTLKSTLNGVPALASFFKDKGKDAPSYVDPNVLAQVLVGTLTVGARADETVRKFGEAVGQMGSSALKTQLQGIAATVGKAENLVVAVADGVDRALTMLGDGYKRTLQKQSFLVGLVLAAALNLDTVTLTATLYRNKEIRDATTAAALAVSEKTSKEKFDKCRTAAPDKRKEDPDCAPLLGLLDLVAGRNELLNGLPIGWHGPGGRLNGADKTETLLLWLPRLCGWLLTALAVSLGAPFWFDLLSKLVNVRHGMSKPKVKVEEKKSST